MKKAKSIFKLLICGAALVLFAAAGQAAAQTAMTLRAVGNGERVKIAAGGKSKIVNLDADFGGDFTPGGDAPHRYTTLLSIKKGDLFYLVAKFRSRSAITDPNAPCGGDSPTTLLLIRAGKTLQVEKVQTEVLDSCAFNGTGRELKGKPQITKNKISIRFDEGAEKYVVTFDANEGDKGLQTTER